VAALRPFESVLIANRGEIAVRIARTCRALGIRSIAIYSDADAGALHTSVCDEAVAIGGVAPRDSYLRQDVIIAAACKSGAQAVHPGYGFLSENAEFARACRRAGLVFVGPPSDAMQAVGDKIHAKEVASGAGIPVLPGYSERGQSPANLLEHARRIGTPILIKAAGGGGGRGMRLVQNLEEFEQALEAARREAGAAFGDPTVFLERYVAHPRHIEVQVLADDFGNVMAFAERECSIQRRYQKIVEESPSSAVGTTLRAKLQGAAVKLARAVGYRNAGTVEFLVGDAAEFYFLEMNARLQVEHPVTEMVSGLDLVREQLMVAAGHSLVPQARERDRYVEAHGHAIEVRVYAEDAAAGFLPSTGRITTFVTPSGSGVRNDVAVEAGSTVSAAYDPMIAKLVTHAATRDQCVRVLGRALDEYVIGGVATNLGFLRWLVDRPDFVCAQTRTDFLERNAWDPRGACVDSAAGALAAAAALSTMQWRHSSAPHLARFEQPGIAVEVRRLYAHGAWEACSQGRCAQVKPLTDGAFALEMDGRSSRFAAWRTAHGVSVSFAGLVSNYAVAPPPAAEQPSARPESSGQAMGWVQAPMSGTVVKVNVKPHDRVSAFAVLAVMEAMKMEHSIVAPYGGVVTHVRVRAGDTVNAGDTLVQLSEA
jgi:3-methylcrotonyl-CoA carboxylase alpha subunit